MPERRAEPVTSRGAAPSTGPGPSAGAGPWTTIAPPAERVETLDAPHHTSTDTTAGADSGSDPNPVWLEVLNTDASVYGGSGVGNMGRVQAEPVPHHGRRWSASVRIPPLGALILVPEPRPAD